MTVSVIVLSFLLLPFPFASPQDATLGQRYEAAQELARAGKLAEAETNKSILAAEYRRLIKSLLGLRRENKDQHRG